MNHRRLWVAAAIIGLIILAGFFLSVPHTRDLPVAQVTSATASAVPVVTFRDVFKKGTHTISGSIMAPNACMAVSSAAHLAGVATSSQSIQVELTMPPDTGICLQVPTKIPFQTALAAPAHLPVTITVNGVPATSTLP